jgi:hypothetical protein
MNIAEHPGSLQSSVWRLGSIEYKKMDKRRVETIECVHIYQYISFAMRVLFLLSLVLFTWMALWKIRNTLTRLVFNLIGWAWFIDGVSAVNG